MYIYEACAHIESLPKKSFWILTLKIINYLNSDSKILMFVKNWQDLLSAKKNFGIVANNLEAKPTN